MRRSHIGVLFTAVLVGWTCPNDVTAGDQDRSLVFDGYEIVLEPAATNLVMHRLEGVAQPQVRGGEAPPLPDELHGGIGSPGVAAVAASRRPRRVPALELQDDGPEDSGLWVLGENRGDGESGRSGWGWLADSVSASRRAAAEGMEADALRAREQSLWMDTLPGMERGSSFVVPRDPNQDPFISGPGMMGIDGDTGMSDQPFPGFR